jgi:hypothetical protein
MLQGIQRDLLGSVEHIVMTLVTDLRVDGNPTADNPFTISGFAAAKIDV